MRGPNFPFAPTKTYCPISVNLREKWKPLFLFSLCSFPPSLSFFFFFFPLFYTFSLGLIPTEYSWFATFSFSPPPFFLFFFSFSLFTRTSFFCLFSFFLFIFSLFHFSHFFHFLFSFFFSFSPPFLLLLPLLIKSGGNFPPFSYLATCHLYNFLYFSFFLYPTLDTWLNVSDSFKFATQHGYHAMCHFPRVPCGIHMVMSCVTRHSMH